ncbi:hypothetical protein [Schaedlerella arabinosiphila]|uniref:hypothetical protein n=1 Tax=Schaedlerella arabinosiphila TaxID=2044587 RepID=UPI0025581C3C|nr:hypothetical protein [Schaedlerella arabinosiphila]
MDNLTYQGATAWMIRRDGSFFPVVQHIYGNPEDVEETLFAAEWLYERTRCRQTRRHIEAFVRMWGLQFAEETNGEALRNRIYRRMEERPYQFIIRQFADKIADIITQWKEQGGHTDEAMDINGYCRQVVLDLNEEFMRVRFGGKYHTEPGNRNLYFRISSENYNWSKVIREFDNRVCSQLHSEGFLVMVDEESAEVNPAIVKQRKYFLDAD